MSDEAVRRNTALNIAVGMGVPFRFAFAIAVVPSWLFFVLFTGIFAPHACVDDLINFAGYWHWIRYGGSRER